MDYNVFCSSGFQVSLSCGIWERCIYLCIPWDWVKNVRVSKNFFPLLYVGRKNTTANWPPPCCLGDAHCGCSQPSCSGTELQINLASVCACECVCVSELDAKHTHVTNVTITKCNIIQIGQIIDWLGLRRDRRRGRGWVGHWAGCHGDAGGHSKCLRYILILSLHNPSDPEIFSFCEAR